MTDDDLDRPESEDNDNFEEESNDGVIFYIIDVRYIILIVLSFKFSRISYQQVVRPQVSQRLEVGTQNSVSDKENLHVRTPVCIIIFEVFVFYLILNACFYRILFNKRPQPK